MRKVSIVTICFNNLDELLATMKSVDDQSVKPFEHWIIDGSTNTDILASLTTSPQPEYRKWIHERDNGIADAFNKGIVKSNGDVIHILNSGDKYYSREALEVMQTTFDNDPDLVWAHSKYVQNRGGINVISGAPFNKEKLWKGMRTVAHPTMFVRKLAYETHGLFNTNLKIAMDYDFLMRIREEKFVFVDKPLVYFSPGGASDSQFKKGLEEVKESYRINVGNSFKMTLWQARQKALHFFMQTTIGRLWFRLKNRNKIVA